jgi:microtubule-associated serine/threonine kinase
MEYVEGGDCANLLKNMGPFPPDMARFRFWQSLFSVEIFFCESSFFQDVIVS